MVARIHHPPLRQGLGFWRVERRLADAGLAALLLALGLFEVWFFHLHPLGVAVPAMIVSAAALAWRRAAPLLTVALALGPVALESVLGVSVQKPDSPLLIALVAVYTAGAYLSLRDALAALALAAACVGIATAGSSTNGHSDLAFTLLVVTAGWLVGRGMHSRVVQTTELTERTRRLEHESEAARAEAVAEERRRIARDLHDVIAHSISVMVVQAGAAEEIYARDPSRVLDPIRAVQETGRAALVEMTRLLGILREDGAELGLDPQPRIDELPELVEQTRAAGAAVHLMVEGNPRPLPVGIELSLYRIAQEALTNVRKHAAESRASVTLRYGDGEVELCVDNEAGRSSTGHSGGHGLIGMRERVAVFGGTLEAGPRPGGFRVVAVLPTRGSR